MTMQILPTAPAYVPLPSAVRAPTPPDAMLAKGVVQGAKAGGALEGRPLSRALSVEVASRAPTSSDIESLGLTEEEQAEVRALQARDREVRAHEAAHRAAGGVYASAASFTFQTGPDGRAYAIGGEVRIDTSAIPGDPAATIAKLRQVKAAALAPAQPSPQDFAVAASAERAIRAAQAELGKSDGVDPATGGSEEDVTAPRQEGPVQVAAGGQPAEGEAPRLALNLLV